jgi:hypothetical protein
MDYKVAILGRVKGAFQAWKYVQEGNTDECEGQVVKQVVTGLSLIFVLKGMDPMRGFGVRVR